MPRPNRKTVEAWYDVFADMDPEEQAIAMRVLEQTHRLAKRAAPKAGKLSLLDEIKDTRPGINGGAEDDEG